jgi:SAM-dependent methyltransferase/signal transduction histidine kinase
MNTTQRNKVSDYLEQHKQEYLKQNVGRSGIRGMFYTPDKICELIESIARIYNPQNVIDICCGTGNLLSYFDDLQIVKGIDINPESISLAQVINPNISFLQADTLEYNFGDIKYDLVLGSLPFGIKLLNQMPLEALLINKGLELLSKNGTAIFVVPEVLLFGEKYRSLRAYLVEKFALDMVVSLPIGIFNKIESKINTSIFNVYTGIKTSLLIIRNEKPNTQIFMPVFEGDTAAIAYEFKHHQGELYIETSKINDRLDRNFYLSMQSIEEHLEKYKTVKLSDIATIISGERFQPDDFQSSGKYLVFNRKDKEGNNFVNTVKNDKCILRENDIVVGLIGKKSVVEIYENSTFDVVVPKDYAIIRQSGNPDNYLNLKTYLKTEQGKLFFQTVKEAAVKDSTIPHLSIKSLLDVTVPLIPLEELTKLFSQDAGQSTEIKDKINQYFELIEQGNYEGATVLVEQGFKHYDDDEKKVYYKFIHKNQELNETIEKLKQKDQELEDMMSMFAHKFRSPLDAIVYNTNHEKNPSVYIEAAQTMRGLLDIFSIISTDDKLLKEKLKDDIQGKGRLINVLNSTLKMALLHLLSVSAVEKIHQHYMSYAIQYGKVDKKVTPKIWRNDYDEIESSLQLEWEKSFSDLISNPFNLNDQLKWIEQHFFKLEIIGFDREDIQFNEYGITESFLVILLNEIIVNAFKYYASDSKKSVVLRWVDYGDHQAIECLNPSTRSERTTPKGSRKGHTFLSALARKTNSHFIKPEYQDDFVIVFGISTQLLKNKT